jgi:tetratricopeptide (TPR) repeat protein
MLLSPHFSGSANYILIQNINIKIKNGGIPMNALLKKIKSNFLYNSITSRATSQNCCYFLAFSVILFIAYFFLRLPILSTGDTDLWYHLSGGRYFSQHFKIPESGFFSFIAESRHWSNYYWLFQVIVYYIHSIFGYYGLVILKAFFYILSISIIAFFLFKNETNSRKIIYFTTIFICLCIALIPRYYTIMRPHMFSYLFIPTFIYLFEYKPRFFFILPILAVIWANSHGVEYPVLVLICLSYSVEYYFDNLRHKVRSDKKNLIYLAVAVVTIWAILINPDFNKLLTAPFDFAKHQDQYIGEIVKINIADFFTFKVWPITSIFWSITNILIIMACIGAIKGLINKNIRVSHILLVMGGIFLLTRSQRFQYEAMLLALPMLKSQPLLSKRETIISKGTIKNIVTSSFALILSFYIFFNLFNTKTRYPFSDSHLPKGVVTFLNHVNTGGSILNNPNHGGYLQWELSPKYKIAMDLQMVLFQDDDYFTVSNALNTKNGLAHFKAKHNPDYIINDRNNINFKKIIEDFPAYKPIFFDFSSVLYANKETLPESIKKYELKNTDPYNMLDENLEDKKDEQINKMLSELTMLNNISSADTLINFELGRIYKKLGDLKKAYNHAGIIINNYPESAYGYTLMGDLFMDDKLYDKATSFYKKGLKCPEIWSSQSLYKKLALAYSKTNKYKKAYRTMKKAVDVFSFSTDYNDIWMLGNMAILSGEYEDGVMYLRFSVIKAPQTDKEFIKRVQEQIKDL